MAQAQRGSAHDDDIPDVSLIDGKYWVFAFESAGPLAGVLANFADDSGQD